MQTPSVFWQVALPFSQKSVFDYLPLETKSAFDFKIGIRVQVPFGNRKITGILLKISKETNCPLNKLKKIIKILDLIPVLDQKLLEFCTKTATYYHRTIGETIFLALPNMLREGQPRTSATYKVWRLNHNLPKIKKNAKLQLKIIEVLQHGQLAESYLHKLGFSTTTLKNLQAKKIINATYLANQPCTYNEILKETPKILNNEQLSAVQKISTQLNIFSPILLQGVTSSGKTEIYFHLIEKILKQQKQILMLIPEIGLAPQTFKRFTQRFNVPVIYLHSGLSNKIRYQGWEQAANQQVSIIICTRSGIFTNIPKLGMIIVDEEHDSSYKQQEGIRYSARDLAILRGKQLNIPVILGSATPSFETLYNALQKKYTHIYINKRAGVATLPILQLTDIRKKRLQGGLSKPVIDAINDTLTKKEQVLIFINHRGFASTLICHQCGHVMECIHCDARLILHLKPYYLHCHHCDYKHNVPKCCPKCNHHEMVPIGTGTERIEQLLSKIFVQTEILRIDRDSTRKKNIFSTMLKKIEKNQPAILIGTMMIAKGHHFPKVTLAIILDIDSGFLSVDFRGEEKTAQLILQVAGRAGRGSQLGKVLIQTHHPDNPDLLTLIEQGYTKFAKQQLKHRQNMGLPPFVHLALLIIESVELNIVDIFLKKIMAWSVNYLQQHNSSIKITGPIPVPMVKKKNKFRGQLLLQSHLRSQLHEFLNWLKQHLYTLPTKKQSRWIMDIDPQNML